MIEIRYIAFHLLLVIILFIFSSRLSKVSPKLFWNIAFVPLLAFTLEEGLRWGREIDWCVYYTVYKDINANVNTGHEPLFTLIWWIFGRLGAEYYVVIAFCSFLLAFSIFFFFKPYKEINKIAIPLAFLMVASNATNLIRWFMGVSFLLISLRYYLDSKQVKSLIFAIATCCTHIGLIIVLPLLWFLLRKKTRLLKPKTAIIISIILVLVFDRRFFSNFAFIFDWFNFYSRFAGYQDSAAEWLSGEASAKGVENYVVYDILLVSLPLFFFIYYGYKAIANNKEFIPLWNAMVIGIYLKNMSRGLELIGRYSYVFDIILCINGSYALLYVINKRDKELLDYLGIVVMGAFVLKKIYAFCISNYDAPELMQYVWDMQTDPSTLIYHYYLN